jgi:hypothetical protein
MPRTAERHRGMKMVAETASGCGSGCGMLLGGDGLQGGRGDTGAASPQVSLTRMSCRRHRLSPIRLPGLLAARPSTHTSF